MPGHVQHDFCHAVTERVLELFKHMLRGGEAREAYAEIYSIAREEVGNYEAARCRQEARLHPTDG